MVVKTAPPTSDLAAMVDQTLERPGPALRFPAALEARFDADSLPARMRRLRLAGVCGAVFYGLFLLCDMRMAPDVLRLAEEARIGVAVLALLCVAVMARVPMPQWLREVICGVLTLLALSGLMLTFLASHSPDRIAYVNATILVVLYGAVCLPTGFMVAAAVTLLSCAIIASGVMASTLSIGAKDGELASALGLIALTLFMAWRLERQQRRAYLLGLREILRNGALLASNAALRRLAERDGLTGTLNRRGVDAALAERLAASRRAGQPIGVIMVDVDHFKMFNDQHGHPAGDVCLRRVAALMQAELRREVDVLGRYGGEEFLVILPDRDVAACIRVAHRIRRAIEGAAMPHGAAPSSPGVVTASLGVAAAAAASDETAEDLVRRADEQLYGAKQAGRNRVCPSFVLAMETA